MVRTLERLDKQTAVHRCVADADRLALTDHPATEHRYNSYLVRTYGFQAPLESAFAVMPELSAHVDLSHRVWSGVLASDLVALGYPIEQILDAPVRARAPFRTLTEALGWLYVAEQTRNGHQLLRHYLATKLARLSRATCVARVTKSQWAELAAVLDRVESQDALEHAIVDAFEAQHRWFRPGSPSATTVVFALHQARTSLPRVR
jgi:heme oxygenase